MNLYSQVMQLDFFLILTIVFLGIFLWINRSSERELNIKIKQALAFIFALAMAENMEVHNVGVPERFQLYKFGVLAETILWVLVLVFSVRVIQTRPMTKKEQMWLYLPAALNTLLVLPGFFSDYLIWMNEAGVVQRSSLSYLYFPVGISYFIFVIRIVREQRMRGFREEALILEVGDAAVLIGAVTEMIAGTHGLMASAVTLTLTFYYLYLHMDHSKRDMLTGALTRACFFSDLSRIRSDQLTAFCEFDMNNLKTINDQQGHQAGDEAIVFMYRTIISCLPASGHVYRFGGDEFAVLFYNVNMSTVYSTVYKIRELFAASDYGCAIGIAEWLVGETFQEVYSKADRDMYEDKKKQKAALAERLEEKSGTV